MPFDRHISCYAASWTDTPGRSYVLTLTSGQAIVDTYRTSVLPQSFQDTLDLHDLLETPLNYGSRDDSS